MALLFKYDYVKLVRVIDGDTVELDIDLGFHIHVIEKFRLSRIDTPEMNTDAGKQAKIEITVMLQAPMTIASTGQDKYGRWLAEIYVGNVNVNDWMVENGFAVPYAK